MPSATTVVNIKTVREDFDVYIGRATSRSSIARCHAESRWANHYRGGKNGVRSAEEAVALYEQELRARVSSDWIRECLLMLDGKRLGCWCKPGPCHGDAIVRVIEDIKAGRL